MRKKLIPVWTARAALFACFFLTSTAVVAGLSYARSADVCCGALVWARVIGYGVSILGIASGVFLVFLIDYLEGRAFGGDRTIN
jgi:hypothetical protein